MKSVRVVKPGLLIFPVDCFRGSQQNRADSTENPHISLLPPYPMVSLTAYQQPPTPPPARVVRLLQSVNLVDTSLGMQSESVITLGLTLGAVPSRFGQMCPDSCLYCHSVVQNPFPALQGLSARSVIDPSLPSPSNS